MPAIALDPSQAEIDPFADLLPSSPGQQELIGGLNGEQAFQRDASGAVTEVPKAMPTGIETPDYFSDLIPPDKRIEAVAFNPRDQSPFADLIPDPVAPDSEKALAETPEGGAGRGFAISDEVHQAMNAVRNFGSAAGEYIFKGLEAYHQNQAQFKEQPGIETKYLSGSFGLPPEQAAQLDAEYLKKTGANVSEEVKKAEYWKQRAAGAAEQSGVDPALEHTTLARLSHAGGSAAIMGMEALIPGAGLPLMVAHGALAVQAEVRNRGGTETEAEAAAVRSAIGLAIFGAGSKLAAVAVARVLPKLVNDPATLIKFIAQFVGQEAANETSSRAIAGWEAAANAPEGERVQKAIEAMSETPLEQTVLNTVYAVMGAAHAAGKGGPPAPGSKSNLPQNFSYNPASRGTAAFAANRRQGPRGAQPLLPGGQPLLPSNETISSPERAGTVGTEQTSGPKVGQDYAEAPPPTIPPTEPGPVRATADVPAQFKPSESVSKILASAEPVVSPKLREGETQGEPAPADIFDPTAPKEKRSRVTKEGKIRETASDGGFSEDPLVAFIMDHGGILSKSSARRKMGKEKFDANASLWDGAPHFSDPRHNKIYNPRSGQHPDVLAKIASDEGLLPEGADAESIWRDVIKAAQSARTRLVAERGIAKDEKAGMAKWKSQEKSAMDPNHPNWPDWNVPLETHAEKIKLKAKKEGGFVNADIFKEAAQFGARLYERGIKFAEWSGEMVRHLGSQIKAHLSRIWQSIRKTTGGGRIDERGAIGGSGKKLTPKPIGSTPMGDKNWLRIPSAAKRVGRGLFTEGASGVLGRTNNKVGRELGKATRRHVDIEQELFGMHEKILRKAQDSVPKARQDAAYTEIAQHNRDKANGRPTTPLQPDAQRIQGAWNDVWNGTGDIARANNVQVFDPKLGGYRRIGKILNDIPRMFTSKVEAALRDPAAKKNVALFNQLAQAMATHRGITYEQAGNDLRKVAGRFTSNDHMANIEMARTEQMPEIFYEYDLRNLASRYLPGFSERMAQIIAFGQRLGTREAPSKMNLWDIARRESEDPRTQEWLNAAEDQGTGTRLKSGVERNARRAQALGNASLLSDPTTTVVRNLLSGLAVTTERFGIGRSLRQLAAAGRAASRMDAREVGVIRSDIGAFLGAEQLGDAKLDNFIRSLQQRALGAAGFTGSETTVRTHNFLVASKFARDAAAALAKIKITKTASGSTTIIKGSSALAREALAQFKRTDVNPELILAEKGEWRTGPETRKFIRTSVRDSQGGYRYDQVPLWAGSTAGRFLYQYGRWSIQRAGNIMRETVKPAIGRAEKVEFRGQHMTRRNVLPFMRLGLLTVGLGEAFTAITSLLFGRDRRDSSFAEIAEAWKEDEWNAVGLLAERIVNDVIAAGTLGLISQPVDFIKSAKDQSRLKNPAEPPSLAGVKALLDLAQKAYEQGGTLTKRDWLAAAASILRGPKNVYDVLRHQFGATLYEAQNDVRTLRNAAKRWAKVEGLDVPPAGFGDVHKSPKAPIFEKINDALLSGDAETAIEVAQEFVDSSPDKKKAKQSITTSITGRHPFRVGPFASDEHQKSFVKWAEKNLDPADMEQIDRVIKTYESTSKKVLPKFKK